MDSSKPAYEPVSTEEPATTEVEDENAGDTTPIVDSTPAEVETPPEVAEKNEKNAEKTAAAAAVVTPTPTEETAEKKKEEEPEQNGNVSLDLDSSIVPLKEAEETPHTDDEPHANGKLNGENGMVSIELPAEELQMEEGNEEASDLKTKKSFHCPSCPKCPSMPSWRPTKWTPSPPAALSSCTKKEVKEAQLEEGNVVPVEEGPVSHAERYRWIAAVSFLVVALLVVILVFVLIPRQEEQRIPLHDHHEMRMELHLNCDCPGNDLILPAANATVTASGGNDTAIAAPTVAAASELTTMNLCADACIEATECVAAVFHEESKVCTLKTLCKEMTQTVRKLIAIKSS